jgi:hypothetical protein
MQIKHALIVSTLVAVPLFGQQPAAQQNHVDSKERPALINDLSASPNDSPIVRAAKNTVAARRKSGGRSTAMVIDNSFLAKARGYTLSGPQTVTKANALPQGAAAYSGPADVEAPAKPAIDRAALEKRAAELKSEIARMGHEANDEPYGGDVEEDGAQQRLATASTDLNTVNQTLQTPTAPPPQPVQPPR